VSRPGTAAITGVGVVSSLGIGRDAYVAGLREGRSGIKPISLFRTEGRCRVAGEATDFDPRRRLDRKEARRLDRGTQMGVAAALEAIEQASLNRDDFGRLRVGVSLATCAGGMERAIDLGEGLKRGRLHATFALQSSAHGAASWLGRTLGCRGPSATFSTACSASATALGFAFDMLREDLADVVLAGGYEPLCEVSFAGFACMKAFAQDVVRPFDRNRSGLLLGEGAAVFVLEHAERARARGATVQGALLGYGATCDAYHTTMPEPSGEGAGRAMAEALRDAALEPADVDHINAHGTATRLNDPAESRAIHAALGPRATTVPVTSVKSSLGHTLGAAGALEVAASLLAANEGFIPPTLNYESPDPECPLEVVAQAPRPARVARFLSNSFGFGGSNVSLAVATVHGLSARG
jgi:3-oxoacyl-(acyl-carrier-protein) synthase